MSTTTLTRNKNENSPDNISSSILIAFPQPFGNSKSIELCSDEKSLLDNIITLFSLSSQNIDCGLIRVPIILNKAGQLFVIAIAPHTPAKFVLSQVNPKDIDTLYLAHWPSHVAIDSEGDVHSVLAEQGGMLYLRIKPSFITLIKCLTKLIL